MKEILKELNEKYNILSVKAELESEGSSFDEIISLKEICNEIDLNLTIKIGGCGAINDIRFAKSINAQSIVAPMIESDYALKKFIESVNTVYENGSTPNLYINIETETGYKNRNEIIESEYFENISGIILGRSDMAASLNIDKTEINNKKIQLIAENLSERMSLLKKDFIIGGCINTDSIRFLNVMPYLTGFETRKIIFNTYTLNFTPNEAIQKAIDFEILYLKNKQNPNQKDLKRLKMLEESEKIYA